MPDLEERQARIEGVLEQMDKRLSAVESAVRALDSEIKALRIEINGVRTELASEINSLRTELTLKMDSSFKWLVGIIFTMWVTIILTILVKT